MSKKKAAEEEAVLVAGGDTSDGGASFARLRRRLQLTNLRIARLYLLLKGQSRAHDDAEQRDVLEELYVTDHEFQQHLSALSGLPPATLSDPDAKASLDAIDRASAVLKRRIQAEELAAKRDGAMSRFESLCERCAIEGIDAEILLITLAPEIDRRYRRVFAYLHDDFTRGIPSVGLVTDILAPLADDVDRLELLAHFESESPLIKRGLVDLLAARSDDVKPLSQRHLKVGDAAAGWVVGVPRLNDSIRDRARYLGVPGPAAPFTLPPSAAEALNTVVERIRTSSRGVSLFVLGRETWSSDAACFQIAHSLGIPVVRVEMASLLASADRAIEDVTQILRDAFLFGAALQVVGFPDVSREDPAVIRSVESLWRRLQEWEGLIFLPSIVRPPGAWLIQGRHALSLTIEAPNFSERQGVFSALLDASEIRATLKPDQVETLASRYKLGRQQIQQAVAYARDIAWARALKPEDGETDPGGGHITFEDLVEGARAQFSRDLGSLARRVNPRFDLDDLVLPDAQKDHLVELVAFVERRGIVYETWGFQAKFPRGAGAKALFHGRSGTGKTMAAEVLAKALGLDLFKVDLSSVISKWVGETEKNLASIFDRAEEAQAVLLFDEADALFGARTNVGNAVDRYANLETNYLLQRIEDYDGVAILSSNLKQNIDEAFTRRFHFIMEFPFPDRDSREEIWQRAYPVEAPLADDVDFGFLADQFKFTGGNIKNSVLRSAFLGATHGDKISMVHVLRGVLREYQNLERDPTERDFGSWWKEIKPFVDEANIARRGLRDGANSRG